MKFFARSTLGTVGLLSANGLPGVPQQPSPPPAVPFVEQASKNVAGCFEPPPLPGLEDYDGPLKKTVGLFGRELERKSVHQPHYKPGVLLCSLDVKGKFLLFVDDFLDPVTFLSAGFDAAQDQASNRDPTFGQGAEGYGKRFGATLADRASSKFFKDFAYPSLFSEDPRYYRLGQGTGQQRFLHAAEHLFVAHHGDGRRMFNYSERLGTGTSVALSDLYHPGNERGFGAMAGRIGSRFAMDIGFDVLREFWPDISHKFKLPFRGEPKRYSLDRPLPKAIAIRIYLCKSPEHPAAIRMGEVRTGRSRGDAGQTFARIREMTQALREITLIESNVMDRCIGIEALSNR